MNFNDSLHQEEALLQTEVEVPSHLLDAMLADPKFEPLTDAEILFLARKAEQERQLRIAMGIEHQCVVCGCSESLTCPGGCVWAKPNLCSRCARNATEASHGA